MATKTKPKPKKKALAEQSGEREVKYPDVDVIAYRGAKAISVDLAKTLLGWHEENVHNTYDLLIGSKKVQLLNNVKNRPLYTNVAEALQQEHLNRRWKFNGEPIIIGKTGLILNGQHTLVSLILAEEERTTGTKAAHWQTIWPEPITMEKIIVYGVDEDDGTVNTMDTCKPRSLADVIYRSEYFSKLKAMDRKTCSRMTDNAIRLLWARTGQMADPYAPKRTHAEALDFLARHPRILRAVRFIFDEYSKKIGTDNKAEEAEVGPNSSWMINSKRFSPGYAAGVLYLQGSCSSEIDVYRAPGVVPSEKNVNWEYWDKACDFWIDLIKGANGLDTLRIALGKLYESGSPTEKAATLTKAWHVYLKGQTVTESDLELEYKTDQEGIRHLINVPDLAGIDQPVKEAPPTKSEKEAIEEAKKAERDAKQAKILENREKQKKAADAKKKKTAPVPKKPPMIKKKPVPKAKKKAETNGQAEATPEPEPTAEDLEKEELEGAIEEEVIEEEELEDEEEVIEDDE